MRFSSDHFSLSELVSVSIDIEANLYKGEEMPEVILVAL